MMVSNEAIESQDFAVFAEGEISLDNTQRWFCDTHSQWVKTGKNCLFCEYDERGDAMFANFGS